MCINLDGDFPKLGTLFFEKLIAIRLRGSAPKTAYGRKWKGRCPSMMYETWKSKLCISLNATCISVMMKIAIKVE